MQGDATGAALSEFDFCVEVADDSPIILRSCSTDERDVWAAALNTLLCQGGGVYASDKTARDQLAMLPSGGKIHSVSSQSLKIQDVFKLGEILGSGVAGEVHRAQHKATNTTVAIKTISKTKFLANERAVTTTRREIDILKQLSSMDTRHPHVVDLYAVIETTDSLYLPIRRVTLHLRAIQSLCSLCTYRNIML